MGDGIRFIHTADWQVGLRAHFIPGDAGAVVRDARLRTIQRIGALAQELKIDFILVAGDVYGTYASVPLPTAPGEENSPYRDKPGGAGLIVSAAPGGSPIAIRGS